ncbi:MAG: glycosyltransferase family 39 protein [Microgenomates group bacterium]
MSYKTGLLIALAVYTLTRIWGLHVFPVFADEAIYIRWAQLIIDSPSQYAFFPLNDGKTPFFIWMMVPFQYLFENQLVAGRIVSVLMGAVQLITIGLIARQLDLGKKLPNIAIALVVALPFWVIHHHLALIDGTFTAFLTLAVYFLLLALRNESKASVWRFRILAGVFFGVAFLTKIPAVLMLPPLFLLTIFYQHKNQKQKFSKSYLLPRFVTFISMCTIAFGMFGSLKIHPAFGQLFSRGGDFLHPVSEVVMGGLWMQTIQNIPTYASYFLQYLTPTVSVLLLIGLFLKRNQQKSHLFFWSGILFILPIMIFGKVVYPRYLFPATLFFTISAALSFESLFDMVQQSKGAKQLALGVFTALLIANTVTQSIAFLVPFARYPNSTPFVSADREQYLTEWSSGHGIFEVSQLIQEESQHKKIAVATEGYFGTLPDGILLYLHRKNVDNIYVEGIGQPVVEIPQIFIDRSQDYDEAWLVVNSHRNQIDFDSSLLIEEYCRPYDAPCLQIWDITNFIKNSEMHIVNK